MSDEIIAFLANQVRGWISTLMRDLDAQGTPVQIDDVVESLHQVITELTGPLTEEEFTAFLRELNEGGND